MTTVLLMEAIKTFLDSELAGDVTTIPAIHLGLLPEKKHDNLDEQIFPFIIILPVDSMDTDDQNKVQIRLLFGIKSFDNDGFMDALNLMERVRIALLRKRMLEQRFVIDLPYKSKFFDDQPLPEWFGEAVTTWTLPTIQQEVEGI